MVTVLGWILTGITTFGTYVLWGVESAFDALAAALVAAYNAAIALLPGIGDAPSLPSGAEWLGWLNWFYPVGDLVGILSGLLTMWLSYLAVRYVLRLVRGL